MLSWTEVETIANRIPGLVFHPADRADPKSHRSWSGLRPNVIWERPLSKKDLMALGDKAPKGAVLAIHTTDLTEKLAWIETEPVTCFDSPHFTGYPAVLVNLDTADPQVVFELIAIASELLPKKPSR